MSGKKSKSASSAKSKKPLRSLDATGVSKALMASISGVNDPLEKLLRMYMEDYLAKNKAAHEVYQGLKVLGIGIRPIIDHITFRTVDADRRAREFISYGYQYERKAGIMEYENWWAKMYAKPGYPTIFIDQAFAGRRGRKCIIPDWVKRFGDKTLHHVAILVDDIEQAVFYLEKHGIRFMGKIIGERGQDLRQIFTAPEIVDGQVFSVLELIERHRGYSGFLSPKEYGRQEYIHISAY